MGPSSPECRTIQAGVRAVSHASTDAEAADSARLRARRGIFGVGRASMITGTDLRVDAGAISALLAWNRLTSSLPHAAECRRGTMEKVYGTFYRELHR